MMAAMMTEYDAWCIDTGAGTGIGIVNGTGIDIGTEIGFTLAGSSMLPPRYGQMQILQASLWW